MTQLGSSEQSLRSSSHDSASFGFFLGSVWSGITAIGNIAIPFLIFIAFARVLPVVDIGLVALAVAWAELGKSVGFTGVYEALIYHKTEAQEVEQTASAVMIILGCVFFLVFCLLVYFMSFVMHEIVGNVLPLSLLGLRITFDLAMQQPLATLAKRRDYRRLASRSIVANVVAGSVGLTAAISINGLWSLVLYQILQAIILYLMTVIGTESFAFPVFHRRCWHILWKEATWSSLVRMLAGVNNYVDQIFVAYFIGGVPLGYFNLAKRIELALVGIGSSFSGTLFQPLFSSEQDGGRKKFLHSSMDVVVIVCGLPAVVFAVNSHAIVRLAFGYRWDTAAGVAGVLALGGFFRALGGVHGALLSVSGRNATLLKSATVVATVGTIALAIATQFGLTACGFVILAKNIVGCLWEAALTRFEDPQLFRNYLTKILLPLVFICAGAALGREMPVTFTSNEVANEICHILLSMIIATLIATLCLYKRHSIKTVIFASREAASRSDPLVNRL